MQGVSGANIALTKTFGAPHTATLATDAAGEALFSDLPIGNYTYRVTKSGHPASAGSVVVKAGLSGSTEVFLSTDLITIEWSVEETSVDDKYTVVLQATFETEVLA